MIKRAGLTKVGTAVLGMAIVGTTVGGVMGASSVSAAQTRHRAAVAAARAKAADDKARADYATAVQGVAADVLAAMQPMEQVLHGLDSYRPGVVYAIQDALTRAGVSQQLQGAVDRLRAIPAPATVSADATDLVRRGADLHESFASLAGAVSHTADKALFDVLTGAKVDALREAEDEWHVSLSTLYGHLHATTPASPSAYGGWKGPGTVPAVTKATWIARADEVCAQGNYDMGKLPNGKDLDAIANGTKGFSRIMLRVTHDLRAIPRPTADAAQLQATIIDHLGTADAYAHDAARASTDVRARNRAAADDDFGRMEADFMLSKPLERGFRAYGATFCGDFFKVDTSGHHGGGTGSPSGLNT